MTYENKTQEELKKTVKNIKLSLHGGPRLAKETVNNLTTELLKVQALITDNDAATIDSEILSTSLN